MSVYSVAFNLDGKKIYAGNGDGTISEWDVESGKETNVWKAHESFVLRLSFSPDYRLLASFADGVLKLWETSNWREVRKLTIDRTAGASSHASAIAFSNDGKMI